MYSMNNALLFHSTNVRKNIQCGISDVRSLNKNKVSFLQ